MKKKPSIIAVDFDGTCVTHEFPAVGRDIGAAPVLHELVKHGHRLILWTMRSGDRADGTDPLKDAVDWFSANGLPLYGVNENPSQHEWTSSPKAFAHLFIDDAALGIPLVHPLPRLDGAPMDERPYVSWDEVRHLLKQEGYLPPDSEGVSV